MWQFSRRRSVMSPAIGMNLPTLSADYVRSLRRTSVRLYWRIRLDENDNGDGSRTRIYNIVNEVAYFHWKHWKILMRIKLADAQWIFFLFIIVYFFFAIAFYISISYDVHIWISQFNLYSIYQEEGVAGNNTQIIVDTLPVCSPR